MNMPVLRKLLAPLQKARPAGEAAGAPADGDEEAFAMLVDRVGEQAAARRRANLRGVVGHAESMITGPTADGDLDPSWLLRFLSLAQDAEPSDLQAVWGCALAHELLRPGSVSFHTLGLLANCSYADVLRFAQLARFVMNDFVVRLDPEFFEDRGLPRAEFDHLEELGLLLSGEARSKTFDSQVEDRFLVHLSYRNNVLRVEHATRERKLNIPVYRLSRAGTELAAVLSVCEDLDYMMRVTSLFRRNGFRVTHTCIIGRSTDPNVIRHRGFTEIVPLHDLKGRMS